MKKSINNDIIVLKEEPNIVINYEGVGFDSFENHKKVLHNHSSTFVDKLLMYHVIIMVTTRGSVFVLNGNDRWHDEHRIHQEA